MFATTLSAVIATLQQALCNILSRPCHGSGG